MYIYICICVYIYIYIHIVCIYIYIYMSNMCRRHTLACSRAEQQVAKAKPVTCKVP